MPLVTFCFVSTATPGPNNIMLTASGANFGFRKTIPLMLGIFSGLIGLMAVSAFGLHMVFAAFPQMHLALKLMGAAYLFFLAWKIAGSGREEDDGRPEKKPISFLQAALFQFLNPKAVVMAVTVMSTYTLAGRDYLSSAYVVTIVFLLVCIPSILGWATFGTAVGKLLANAKIRKTFNGTMGILTAGSAIAILL